MNENSDDRQPLDDGSLIYTWNHEVLHEETEWVEEFDDNLRALVEQMKSVMSQARGVGLAANQIGVSKRVFVALQTTSLEPIVMVNPEIIQTGGVKKKAPEGCLSVPGRGYDIPRHQLITVLAQDLDGEEFELQVEGFEAQVYQHEIDHLDGKMLYDRLPTPQRKRVLRELKRDV